MSRKVQPTYTPEEVKAAFKVIDASRRREQEPGRRGKGEGREREGGEGGEGRRRQEEGFESRTRIKVRRQDNEGRRG